MKAKIAMPPGEKHLNSLLDSSRPELLCSSATFLAPGLGLYRVLARISKMPVQNSNFKISTRPDLATNLFQILIPDTINSLVC